MLIIEALRALRVLGRLRVIHTWAQGSQGHQGQLGPSGPTHFSRAGLQTADGLSDNKSLRVKNVHVKNMMFENHKRKLNTFLNKTVAEISFIFTCI